MIVKTVGTTVLSGLIAGVVLLVASALPGVGAAPAFAPEAQGILRNSVLEQPVELSGGRYTMVVAEIMVEPGGVTPLHMHPGPGAALVMEGQLTVSMAGQETINSFSSGSAFIHPWDVPHVMTNPTGAPARMLSFEINPATQLTFKTHLVSRGMSFALCASMASPCS